MPHPQDPAIASALRDTVRNIYAQGDREQLTVKRVRTAVETQLKLESGFLKDDSWRTKSKEIIEREAAQLEASSTASSPPSADSSTPISAAKRNVNDGKAKPLQALDTSPEPTSKQKKRKSLSREKGSSDDESPAQDDTKLRDGESDSSLDRGAPPADAGSETDLSDVIDDGPPSKKRRKPSTETGKSTNKVTKKKASSKAKAKVEASNDEDPDAAEIKRLQGWLIKCGIRKMWARELQPYEHSAAKIRHLKSMLSDVGMTGRYSKEKAEQIREARELEADIRATQEDAKRWGRTDADEDGGRPKRRLAKGLEGLDFLGDDDGEETD